MKHSIQVTAKIVFVVAALIAAVSLQRATGAAGAPLRDGAAALFNEKCAPCHGEDGAGNTPAGKQLKVSNLRSAEVKKQADAQLVAVIAKGKDKMPSFESGLSKEQINQLVAHIRSLGKK